MDTNSMLTVNKDAWSDGQIRSKLWMCETLETLKAKTINPLTVWIYGSWYGLAAQMLLMRNRLKIKEIHLFDIDPEVHPIAMRMLDHWRIHGPKIQTHTMDCLTLTGRENIFFQSPPDIVINTSCEHFETNDWVVPIPPGTSIVAQSTDMPHLTHIQCVYSLSDFTRTLGNRLEIDWSGQLDFSYPGFNFNRYMIVGHRR